MIALVFELIFLAILLVFIKASSWFTSTITGFAPEFIIAVIVGYAVKLVVMISSPLPIPDDKIEIVKASVPDPTPTQYFAPI